MKLFIRCLAYSLICSLISGIFGHSSHFPGLSVAVAESRSIEVTDSNQLDFADLGEAISGSNQIFCRISTAESGSANIAKAPLFWSSFSNLISKNNKKKRAAKKKGKLAKFRKLRKKAKALASASQNFDQICQALVESLGVKPKPSPSPTPGPTPLQTPTPVPTPSASFEAIRINCGGPSDTQLTAEYQDTQGNIWQNDQYYFGVQSYFHSKQPVSGTLDLEIWITERYGPAFSYRIPLPEAAKYTVVLHIGEIFWQEPGLRSFDLYLEDQLVLENLDLFASYGYNTPNVFTYEVNVLDGVLDLDFFGVIQYAKINGIEVLASAQDYRPLF